MPFHQEPSVLCAVMLQKPSSFPLLYPQIDSGKGVLQEAELLFVLKNTKNSTLARWRLSLVQLAQPQEAAPTSQLWLKAEDDPGPDLCFSWWRDASNGRSQSASRAPSSPSRNTWM